MKARLSRRARRERNRIIRANLSSPKLKNDATIPAYNALGQRVNMKAGNSYVHLTAKGYPGFIPTRKVRADRDSFDGKPGGQGPHENNSDEYRHNNRLVGLVVRPKGSDSKKIRATSKHGRVKQLIASPLFMLGLALSELG